MRQISLRQRAIEALSRREFSRLELQRKLTPFCEDEGELGRLLDALEKDKLLSNQRFAESLTHRRADKYGMRRLRAEFSQHGLSAEITERQLVQLKATELDRCELVWAKKYGGIVPEDAHQRARHMRFLAGRGFDAETVSAVMRRIAARATHSDR